MFRTLPNFHTMRFTKYRVLIMSSFLQGQAKLSQRSPYHGRASEERSTRWRSLLRSVVGAALGISSVVVPTPSFAVGTRHFVLDSASEFEAGELKGVAVDSLGRLSVGLSLGTIEVPGVDAVWAVHPSKDGVYLGTGNEGKLVLVQSGKASVVATFPALALTSISEAFDKLIVGAVPGARLLELKGGQLSPFADLPVDTQVWATCYNASERALYAATGPEGKLFRVVADGTAQVYFDAEEPHLVSVLCRGNKVLAGSSGDARLYELSGPGRARVVYDFDATEVRAIAAAQDGALYVIANELKDGGGSRTIDKTKPGEPNARAAKGGSGKLFRFSEAGPEELYSDKSEHFVSLAIDDAGLPVIGTGNQGRLLRVGREHNRTILADVEERQVSAYVAAGAARFVVASDPVVVRPVESTFGRDATWTSEVLDCGIRARFGRPSWEQSGKVSLEARTGNTKKPDSSWSEWSAALTMGSALPVDQGRYLQLRARLLSADAVVERIDVPYVTDNLRAVITQIEIKTSASTEGSTGVSASGSPLEGKASSKVKLSWKVDNPDEDQLRYRVEYRPKAGGNWTDALEPGAVHQNTSYEWKTDDLPEGQYIVRVTASDELSNPPSRAQKHVLTSDVVLVDNTAPKFNQLTLGAQLLSGTVTDGVGPVQRLEVRAAGDVVWVPFEPEDGIFDQKSERFSFDYTSLGAAPGTLLTVRAYDTAGNFEVAHVRVPNR